MVPEQGDLSANVGLLRDLGLMSLLRRIINVHFKMLVLG